jgi:hypothetical protein
MRIIARNTLVSFGSKHPKADVAFVKCTHAEYESQFSASCFFGGSTASLRTGIASMRTRLFARGEKERAPENALPSS